MQIEPFGEIDPENLEDYYGGEIEIDGDIIEIDINFDSASVDEGLLKQVADFLSRIDSRIEQAFAAITDDLELDEDTGTARFYLQHHLNELSDDELQSVFGTDDVTEEIFLDNLLVTRIGLYPEDNESWSIIDIKLPDEFTNYLLAVSFRPNGELTGISMES